MWTKVWELKTSRWGANTTLVKNLDTKKYHVVVKRFQLNGTKRVFSSEQYRNDQNISGCAHRLPSFLCLKVSDSRTPSLLCLQHLAQRSGTSWSLHNNVLYEYINEWEIPFFSCTINVEASRRHRTFCCFWGNMSVSDITWKDKWNTANYISGW